MQRQLFFESSALALGIEAFVEALFVLLHLCNTKKRLPKARPLWQRPNYDSQNPYHKFLLLISPVEAASRPVAPNPIEATLTTLIVALLIFLVARLVILTIRDHTV
jgi:hypothetical protein